MKIEKIDPLFPSSPLINPPRYKFKKGPTASSHADPYEPWKEPEELVRENNIDNVGVFFIILFLLVIIFSSS